MQNTKKTANYESEFDEEIHDQTQLTINDTNTLQEMNTAQINLDPESGEEITDTSNKNVPTTSEID